MKLNKKGFTLIELLVTIVIVGLVIGLSAYGIVKVIKNTENEKSTLSESSIKEAARIYSGEADSGSWKDSDDYELFCVTIGELINKDLLEKNTGIGNGFTKDNYVVVKRNKLTLAIEKEELSVKDDANYNICVSQIIMPSEDIIKIPEITTSTSYTDKIEISFNDGSAVYNGEESKTSYRCLYGVSSSLVNREGIIDKNKCILNGLKHNSDYYAVIYMDTNHGSTVASGEPQEILTTDFVNTIIDEKKQNYIGITYSDIDNKGNNINTPSYYFKTNINAESANVIYECSFSNNIFTCTENGTTDIIQNVWYKTDFNYSELRYLLQNKDVNITTRTYDESNNYIEDEKTFKGYYVVTYNGNGSDVTNVPTAEITDIANSTKISEKIPIKNNYIFISWNTNADGSGISYEPGSLYVKGENITLYAQWEEHTNHVWQATGNTKFTLYEPAIFTCQYYHTKGYARYCSVCGMSVRYYKKYVNSSSTASNWWCPCEITSSTLPFYKIFNDSELYNSNAAIGRDNVQKRCGLTCGEPLFDIVPTLTKDCTEHY